jgi:hypothetical protein
LGKGAIGLLARHEEVVDHHEEHRHQEDGEHGGREHPAHHGTADGVLAAGTAPLATARGSTPNTKAKLVIRIGRRRRRAALTAASNTPMPSLMRSSANSTIRIAFLAETPIVVIRPTWR